VRKFGAQAIAWLAWPAATDAIGQNDEIFFRIKRLTGAKQRASEGARNSSPFQSYHAASTQHSRHDRQHHAAACKGRMAQLEFWKRFSGSEFEIFWNIGGLLLRRCRLGGQI
jgi:hypothetical protein